MWTRDRDKLAALGIERVGQFANLNSLPLPKIVLKPGKNRYGCGVYQNGRISIWVEECGYPCGEANSRNWTWPAGVVDREPYGVIAHEFGHYIDHLKGGLSQKLFKASGEPPITNYAPNVSEWFAEIFRLFTTNPGLLQEIRPKVFVALREKFTPIGSLDWKEVLDGAPTRVVKSIENKIRTVKAARKR